jgi:hypothetical protein
MFRPFALAPLFVLAALSTSANAAESIPTDPDQATPSAAPAARSVSLTTDPLRPLVGMAVLGAETRVGSLSVHEGFSPRDVSVVGFVGFGRVRSSDIGSGLRPVWGSCDELFTCDRATTLWLGGQALLYPVGSFEHGAQLGVEASYMRVWGTRSYNGSFAQFLGSSSVPDARLSGGAFAPGVLIGYKLVTKPGFTFNPQLALDAIFASDGSSALAPRLTLNAGWSF